MFSFFKRQFQQIEHYPDTWAISQTTYEGKLMTVRIREGLKKALGHPNFPFQIGIAIPILKPSDIGMPDTDEAALLNIIEDSIQQELCKENTVVLVAVTTFDGVREFILYAKEWQPEDFDQKVSTIQQVTGTHQLQFMMQEDRHWNTFKGLIG